MTASASACGDLAHTSTDAPANSEKKTERQAQQADYSGADENDEKYCVGFDANDPENPQNWSRPFRWYLTLVAGLLFLNTTFASSAPTGIIPRLMDQFGMSREVGILTISLFVAGFCVGPILWGPLSEHIGRKPVFIGSFIFYTAFQIGCALSKNTASITVFRLLSGIFAAAPASNSGALISDIWDAGTRGKALALFALAPFAGPALGPVVGGYISNAGVDWRWLFWVLTIFAGLCTTLAALTMPETYAPVILVRKARRLRQQTGDNEYYAPFERQEKLPVFVQINRIVARPFVILFQEPMLIAITVYMSFIFGCVYLLFAAYPVVFTQGHHLSAGATGLMFLPVFLGGSLGVMIYLFIFNPRYQRAIEKHKPHPVPPEFRLELATVGAPLFTIVFFWFGWTSYPSISFWAPMTSGLGMGLSVVFIFLSLINYMIDTYLFVAASALAANTVVRSSFGAAFPLFGGQMYEALNPRWASTLLGCIAALMIPIPFILIKFGPILRAKSKYAPKLPSRVTQKIDEV